MNIWTQKSIELANQGDYLDQLFKVYPIDQEKIRVLNESLWREVKSSFDKLENDFNKKNKIAFIKSLLKLPLFPLKDSYVAYLRRDPSSIGRNPNTVNRLCGALVELGIRKIEERCRTPKETNRQIGPLFGNWLRRKSLGLPLLSIPEFSKSKTDAILDANDADARKWCSKVLGYSRRKGLDFVARVNKKFVIGEAKFLTDFGGHQNAQLEDALLTLGTSTRAETIKVIIADGVCYIPGKSKLYTKIKDANANIMSALFLRDFLYTI